LQLPLENGEEPSRDRQQSLGRFLALHQEFPDPASVVEGTRVTIVGEVSEAKTDHLDDVEYRYPTLIVKDLRVWPVQSYGQLQLGFSIGASAVWESAVELVAVDDSESGSDRFLGGASCLTQVL
jgi:outer membrane lipoprotein